MGEGFRGYVKCLDFILLWLIIVGFEVNNIKRIFLVGRRCSWRC